MKQLKLQTPALTIGLDLGDRYSRVCALDAAGEVVEEGRIATTEGALRGRFGGMERVRIVMEVGTHSPCVTRLLEELGHEVISANPRKLRLIYENDRKNDRGDAEYLARVGRLDSKLLAPVRHRRAQTQEDLALLRSRDVLVRSRTRLVNHVRGLVKAVGGRLPRCSTQSFATKAAGAIPEPLVSSLAPVLELSRQLSREIRRYDRRIEEVRIEEVGRERYRETQLLRQVPGVGPVTALCYVLTLEDPTRFRKSRAVGPYLGLVARQRDTGESEPQLRITKAGDEMLRRLLVGSAHYLLGPFGPDTDLRRWGLRIAERGGKNAKKRPSSRWPASSPSSCTGYG